LALFQGVHDEENSRPILPEALADWGPYCSGLLSLHCLT